jgi:hypothetical protein
MQCSQTVNVDKLKPFHARADDPPAPGPGSDPVQEGEQEVELLLNRKEICRVLHYLMLWRGHTSADDEWLRAERSWLIAWSGWPSTTLALGRPAPSHGPGPADRWVLLCPA